MPDLVARIRAVLRRYHPMLARPRIIRVMDVSIDLMRQTVTVAKTRVALSRKEFQILALIAEEGGGVCSRDRLVREIRGRPWRGAYPTLNVHMATLRPKSAGRKSSKQFAGWVTGSPPISPHAEV